MSPKKLGGYEMMKKNIFIRGFIRIDNILFSMKTASGSYEIH